jgi:hypothetical protein
MVQKRAFGHVFQLAVRHQLKLLLFFVKRLSVVLQSAIVNDISTCLMRSASHSNNIDHNVPSFQHSAVLEASR